jgi:molybdopterin synthase catalytic subunit
VSALEPPSFGDDWLGLTDQALPLAAASEWAVLPRCGAVVTFSGTARDHSAGRPEVERLEYEAYAEQVVPRLAVIAAEARQRWPELGRLVLLHRHGVVPIGESAVVVVASAPHRELAFEAARFGIDTLKATAPIWKRESWAGGESWGLEPQTVTSVGATDRPASKLSGVAASSTLNLESRSTEAAG